MSEEEQELYEARSSIPVGWLLGIAATLIAAGIMTSIAFSISVSRELGTISARIANLENGNSTPMANGTRERFDSISKRVDDFLSAYSDSQKTINERLFSIDRTMTANAERLARIEAQLGMGKR